MFEMQIKIFSKKILDKLWNITDNVPHEIISQKKGKPFEHLKPDFNSKEVNESYSNDNNKWFHEEFIKYYKNKITIEPDYGYCLIEFNKVIKSSVFFEKLKPSFPRYVLNLFKNKTYLDKAILFDGKVGCNYFHFFSDTISKLELIKEIPDYKNLPLIISRKTFEKKYFQYLFENTDIKKYKWIIQEDNEYIKTNGIYILKPMPYKKEYFSKIKSLVVPDNINNKKNIFLNRSIKTGRYIENFYELKEILIKYNFEVIDTDGADFDYQFNLFNSAKNLISVHGAGNTNLIFTNSNLRFLEIMPGNRISCQYYWLAKTMETDYYDVVVGGNLPHVGSYPEEGFYLNPEEFEKAIIKMLNY